MSSSWQRDQVKTQGKGNRNKALGRIALFLLLAVICIFIVYRSSDSFNDECSRYLGSFGWDVLRGGLDTKGFELTASLSGDEIFDWKRAASKEIGLDPYKYINNTIDIYSYVLRQSGLNDNLRSEVWILDKKIICAYVFHVETNLKIKYWSLNTPLDRIKSDINDLAEEFNVSGSAISGDYPPVIMPFYENSRERVLAAAWNSRYKQI